MWHKFFPEWEKIKQDRARGCFQRNNLIQTNNAECLKNSIVAGYKNVTTMDYMVIKILGTDISMFDKINIAKEMKNSIGSVNKICAKSGIDMKVVDSMRRTVIKRLHAQETGKKMKVVISEIENNSYSDVSEELVKSILMEAIRMCYRQRHFSYGANEHSRKSVNLDLVLRNNYVKFIF